MTRARPSRARHSKQSRTIFFFFFIITPTRIIYILYTILLLLLLYYGVYESICVYIYIKHRQRVVYNTILTWRFPQGVQGGSQWLPFLPCYAHTEYNIINTGRHFPTERSYWRCMSCWCGDHVCIDIEEMWPDHVGNPIDQRSAT